MKRYDVISVGSGLVYAYVRTRFGERNGIMCLPIGTKIQIENISFSVGGGGVNSSVCFSRLGLRAGFIGKIGSGYNGMIILRELKRNNVDFLGVKANGHTGYSIILESDKRNRTILTSKAVSEKLRASEINLKRLKTKWFYFTSLKGEGFETQKRIAAFAKKNGIRIAYNPSSYCTIQGANYLSSILKNTNVLSMNKEEARMLVKKGDLYKGLKKLGAEIVCVTDGENEGGVYDGRFLYRYFPPRVKVKEATGAGDIFCSSFVAGLIKLGDIESALKVAITHAAVAISKSDGVSDRLLSWKEIEKIIKETRFKIRKEEI